VACCWAPRSSWAYATSGADLGAVGLRRHLVEPLHQILARQSLQPIEAEVLDGRGGDGAREDHAASHVVHVEAVGVREIGRERARVGVASTGGIDHLSHRKGRHLERSHLLPDSRVKGRALAALLDDHHLGSQGEHIARGRGQIVGAAEQPGLFVIDQQQIGAVQHPLERGPVAPDPHVHGVDQHVRASAAARKLGQRLRLLLGRHVGQEHKLGPEAGRQAGPEAFEHAQLRLHGFAVLQIGAIAAGPGKGRAGLAIQPPRVHAQRAQLLDVTVRKISADRCHQERP